MSKQTPTEPKPVSRRDMLKQTGLFALATMATALALPSSAEAKVSKRAAGYRAWPRGRQLCMNCRYFVHGCRRRSNCTLVSGRVSPRGWCQLWAR